ncbi:hypothetical protein ACIG47_03315 [Promicromonospora sp. NPDC052451]|uniref:hypothetical protein n=1 Tax=Promicromonospora sp. NPDC052451 TaxID=3364407 RepID=UPI0037CBA038
MTDETTGTRPRLTRAHNSAAPVTAGLAGLILGAGLFVIGTTSLTTIATLVGIAAFLAGLVVLLSGVYKLLQNLDGATQAILDGAEQPGRAVP